MYNYILLMPSISYQTTPKQLPDEDVFDQCSYHDQDSINEEEIEEKEPSQVEQSVHEVIQQKYNMSDVLEEVTDTLSVKITQKEKVERENAKSRIAIEKNNEYLMLLQRQQTILKTQLDSIYIAEEKEKQNYQLHAKELQESQLFTESKLKETMDANTLMQQSNNQLRINNNALTDIIHETKDNSLQELRILEKQIVKYTQLLINKGKNLEVIKKQRRDTQNYEANQIKILKQKASKIQQIITKSDKSKS